MAECPWCKTELAASGLPEFNKIKKALTNQETIESLRTQVERLEQAIKDAPHGPVCNWHIWDHSYSWDETDCTCWKSRGALEE